MCLCVGALAPSACSSGPPHGVELAVELGTLTTRPEWVLLDWLDTRDVLLRAVRVPATGTLPAVGARLATIRVEVPDASADGSRRVIVRAMTAAGLVGAAAATVPLTPGWQTVALSLAPGELADRDGDGVPDPVDDCPHDARAFHGCGPVADAGPPDAAARDAGHEAGQDSPASPDGPGDLPPTEDTADAGHTDDGGASPDLPSPDMPVEAPGRSCGTALLVVDTPTHADAPWLVNRLQALGCSVVSRSDEDVSVQDTNGKSVVVIAESVSDQLLQGRLRDVPVPVVVMEGLLFGAMGMTGPTRDTDFGRHLGDTLVIQLPAHPLAAGLQGTILLLSKADNIGWGKPGPQGVKVASVQNQSDNAVVFAYEAGAAMPALAAPARRVGFAPTTATPADLREGAWRLFDAAVRWAAGGF